MSNVFISYRRGDTEGQATALFIELSAIVGKDSVFMDVDSIAPGRDFRQVLNQRLESCDVVLALIGPGWLDAKDLEGSRRLDKPDDFVRREIETALKRNIPVTPVLVQGAQLPAPERLPRELQDLVYRNAFELRHSRWESDVKELATRLGLSAADADQKRRHPGGRWLRWGALGCIGIVVAIAIAVGVNHLSKLTPNAAPGKENASVQPPTQRPNSLPNAREGPNGTEERRPTTLEYAVGNDVVKFSATVIGDQQLSASKVRLDGHPIFNRTDDISAIFLGYGSMLVGKILEVETVVTNVHSGTKTQAIRCQLTGGQREFEWTVSTPMPQVGDSQVFRTSVRFTRWEPEPSR